ncbi:MAG: hypothetical protein KAT07_08360 [Calditrichia bacterium]|nr:hypothetical protein [Calditrichia bacterium]
MQKLILHFDEDQDKKNVCRLIEKAVNVPTNKLEPFRDDLQSKGFEIKAIAHKSIEAVFSGNYMIVVGTLGESEKDCWFGGILISGS